MNRRQFLKKTLGGIVLGIPLISGCGGDDKDKNLIGPDKPIIPNKAPETTITANFRDDGEVEYVFGGTDSDGSIGHISIEINNGASQNVGNNFSKLVDIIKGSNRVKATAYDDKGKADLSPAEYYFYSPDEGGAKKFIGEILIGRRDYWESAKENVLFSIGATSSFYVDYLIRTKGGIDVVINYIGYEKNLSQEILNQGVLGVHHIPSLYLVRLPEDEMRKKLYDFIDGGFK